MRKKLSMQCQPYTLNKIGAFKMDIESTIMKKVDICNISCFIDKMTFPKLWNIKYRSDIKLLSAKFLVNNKHLIS
jgi:hypothetical protein